MNCLANNEGSPEHLGEIVVGKSWFQSLTAKQAVDEDEQEFVRVNTKLCDLIIGVNDDANISDGECKARLKKLFSKLDVEVEVEFVERKT